MRNRRSTLRESRLQAAICDEVVPFSFPKVAAETAVWMARCEHSVSMRILGTRQEMKATITVGKRRKIDKITGWWILSIVLKKRKCTKIAPQRCNEAQERNHDELLDFFITKVT